MTVRNIKIQPALCASVFFTFFAAAAGAQEPTANTSDPGAADDARAVAAQPDAASGTQTGRPAKGLFRWQDHPSLRFGKGTHIDFRARLQGDVTRSEAPGQTGDRSDVDVARRRFGVSGELAHVVEFQVEREMGSDDPWRDVYVGYRQFDAVRVRAGKFKLPFSLDENTGATNLDFVYRSLAATQLAPGRDRGVLAHGRVLGGIIGYEAGVFDHDGRNARTHNPERVYGGQTTAARLVVEPFRGRKSLLSDLAVGIAATASDVPEGRTGLRGRTILDSSFYSSDVLIKGARRRTGLQAQWRPGPFSVKSEYIRVVDERQGLSVEDTDLSPLVSTGWYVSGTWTVTGEHKAGGLEVPERPLFQGGFGALEIAARIEALGFGSEASGETPSSAPRADVVLGNRDHAATLGVNWYVNRLVKIQLNLIHETLADPAQGPLPAQAGYWSRVLRFQFSL
jgi:phosphate-selective porin OprO/OprP